MIAWVATDLDRTLFCRAWNEQGAVAATWRDEGGSRYPSSWMPAETHRLLSALKRDFRLVAVTARDLDAFRRVMLPGLAFDGPSVIANGAVIIDTDGTIDDDWGGKMAGELAPWRSRMACAAARIEDRFGEAVRVRMVPGANGEPAYVVAKADDGFWRSDDVAAALGGLDIEGLASSVLGPELQLLPPCISKRRGLEEVSRRWFDSMRPTLALGDARGDLGFMRMARWLAAPCGSELEGSWT
jgi:hydroxymethylpyrimidine pyrophosphatase-like HAD family hydrolase